MFFPEKIKSIKSSDKVLEIGPGSLPDKRSDIYLEKNFSEQDSLKQRGLASRIKYNKPVVYYDNLPLPFKDNEFDYIICSHVLEHITPGDLNFFIDELMRVSSKGYIEFPNIFYELICFTDVHKWFMNFRNNEILFLKKDIFNTNYIHKSYQLMFYSKDNYMYNSFLRYKEFFFAGFEWSNKIKYRIVDSFNELINEDDYINIKKYFLEFKLKIHDNVFLRKIKSKVVKLLRFIRLMK